MVDDLTFPVQGEAIDYPQIAAPTAPAEQAIPTSVVTLPDEAPTTPLEKATAARLEGYTWPEIDGHIAQARQLADQFGYSQQQVDDHLGYQPPAPLTEKFAFDAADRMLDAQPTDDPIAAASGDLLMQTRDGIVANPVSQQVRQDYADALLDSHVKSQQDFAQLAVDAVSHASGMDVSQGIKGLAAQLPDPRDVTDYAIGIAAAGSPNGPTSATVRNAQTNLLNAWATTGMTPQDIYKVVHAEPAFMQMMLNPPPIPPGQKPTFPQAADIKQKMPTEPIVGPGSTAYHSNFVDMVSRAFPMIGAMRGAAEGVSGKEPPTSAGVLDKITQIPEGLGWLVGKQVKNTADLIRQVMDPDFQRRLQVGDVTAEERVNMLSAAGLGIGMKPTGALGSGVGKMTPAAEKAMADATEEVVRQGLGRYFPTVKSEAADIARADIRRATGLARNAKDITSQMIEEWRPQVNKLMPEDREFRRGMKAYAEAWQTGKEQWIADGNHPDAYEGPKGIEPPPLSALQALRDHVEDRPGGGRVTGSELEPLANFLRDMFVSMKGEIERNFDMDSWVEHYLPHQYTDRNAFAKAFGSSRRGDPSALNRRSIPYLYDAMLRGLELKHPDVLDGLFHYVQGTVDFIQAEGVLRTGERVGQIAWGRGNEPPVPGWMKLDNVTRKPPKGREAAETVPPQKRIGTDYDRNIEMANKVEGPEGQQALPAPTGTNLEHVAPSATQAQLGHNQPPEPLRIEGPVEPTEAQQKVGYTRRLQPDIEYAWAHPGYATVYNNWAGSGFFKWPRGGSVVSKLIAASNMSTAFKLALTGAHAFNIADAMISSGFGNAFGEIAHGEVVRGIKDLGMSLTILPRLAADLRTGAEFQNIYLGKKADITPTQAKMRDLFIESGGRPLGRGQEMAIGQAKNLVSVWKNGGGWDGLREHLIQRTGEPGEALGMWKAVGAGTNLIGDIMHTISAPLFDQAVPKLKAAAWANEMASYIRTHPQATDIELRAHAREIMDAKDDIFGELNSENVFLPRVVKQSAQIALLSQSWKYGTWRAFGRGAADITTGNWNSSRAKWVLGTVLSYGLIATLAEIAWTGHGPRNAADIYRGPPTGGTYPEGFGFAGDEERNRWLGPFKEFMDIYSGIFATLHSASPALTGLKQTAGYAASGASPLVRGLIDLATSEPGKDWYAKLLEDATPIMNTQQYQKGTNVGGFARWLGFRPQGLALGDPNMLAHILDAQAKNQLSTEQWRQFYANQRLENPDPNVGPGPSRGSSIHVRKP